MRRGLALALLGLLAAATLGTRNAAAQMPSECNAFIKLRDDAQHKGMAIGAAQKRHVDRKEICALVTRYASAEGAALKFLQDNQTWCGIPPEAVKGAKEAHEKTLKFRTAACAEAPQPRPPSLSDAIGTPQLDTGKNTKTGPGTFDTLTGNPLAR